MKPPRREQIQRALRSLAASYAATMELLERTLPLLSEEFSLDPHSNLRAQAAQRRYLHPSNDYLIDGGLLSVNFGGRTCFLGNTYPFKFIACLAQRPNIYVTHEDLLSEVWDGIRSHSTVRSVVKVLRKKLRQAGMAPLAEAIDGTVSGHYALKLKG
jgi:DNA-binding response OmpR family regulator